MRTTSNPRSLIVAIFSILQTRCCLSINSTQEAELLSLHNMVRRNVLNPSAARMIQVVRATAFSLVVLSDVNLREVKSLLGTIQR